MHQYQQKNKTYCLTVDLDCVEHCTSCNGLTTCEECEEGYSITTDNLCVRTQKEESGYLSFQT